MRDSLYGMIAVAQASYYFSRWLRQLGKATCGDARSDGIGTLAPFKVVRRHIMRMGVRYDYSLFFSKAAVQVRARALFLWNELRGVYAARVDVNVRPKLGGKGKVRLNERLVRNDDSSAVGKSQAKRPALACCYNLYFKYNSFCCHRFLQGANPLYVKRRPARRSKSRRIVKEGMHNERHVELRRYNFCDV